MIKIAPSILSANFAQLARALDQCQAGGADYVHVDVMDGHFVPNLTIGPPVVKDLRARTKLPLDVHLMIEKPALFVPDFARAGADIITIHVEACPHLHRSLQHIRDQGVKAGVALNPATPLEMIEYVLEEVDLILIMSVNPGFGGQKFIPAALGKVERLAQQLEAGGLREKTEIEVDGGVKLDNAQDLVSAGADVLVAGSAIFGTPDPAATMVKFSQVGNDPHPHLKR